MASIVDPNTSIESQPRSAADVNEAFRTKVQDARSQGIPEDQIRAATTKAPQNIKEELGLLYDGPAQQEDLSIEDIYNNKVPVGNPGQVGTGHDAYVGTRLGLLSAAMTNTDPVDAIEKATAEAATTRDPQTHVASKLYEYLSELVVGRAEAGARIATELGNPAEADRATQDASALATSVDKNDALENITTQAFRSFTQAQTEQRSMYVQAEARNAFMKSVMLEKVGIDGKWSLGEVAHWSKDIVDAFLIPGRETMSISAFIAGKDDGTFSKLGGYHEAVRAYHDMPYKDQVDQFAGLSEYVYKISGYNNLMYMTLINPFIDKNELNLINLDIAMDAGELALLVGGLAIRAVKVGRNLAEARKAVKILAETGNRNSAASLAARSIVDPRVRRATGIDQVTAATDAQPIDISRFIPDMPDQTPDLAESIMRAFEKDIVDRFNVIDESFGNIKNPELVVNPRFFDDALKRAREEAVVGQLQDYPTLARIVDRTEDGFTVETTTVSKYDAKYNAEDLRYQNEVLNKTITEVQSDLARRNAEYDTAGDQYADMLRSRMADYKAKVRHNESIIKDLEAPPEVNARQFTYTVNEFGELDSKVIKGTSILNSPDLWMNQLLKDFVGDASIADAQASIVSRHLADAWNAALRGTSKRDRQVVSLWLEKGSRDERVFTPAELASGIHTPEGLTKAESPKTLANYYAARRVLDQLHEVKQSLIARKLDVEGFTHEMLLRNLRDGDGKPLRALVNAEKPLDRMPSGITRIYDNATGKIDNITEEMRQKVLDGKYQVYGFRTAVRHGGEEITYGIAKAENIRPRRAQVLNYVKGYIPRTYKNTWYVARKTQPIKVNGIETSRTTTERFFSTLDDANLWRSQKQDSSAYTIARDRELIKSHPSEAEHIDFNTYGGLYTGSRSDRNLLIGIEGKEPLMRNPLEAIEGYLSHISNNLPMNEFRMSVIAKFENSYGKYLPEGWAGPITGLSTSDPIHKTIKQAQDYMVDFLRIRTVEERQWQSAIYSIAETMGHIPVLKGAQKFVLDNLASRDPITALRGAAFHTLLGVFNPRQLLIQGLGAVIVHAQDPVRAPKYWAEYTALRTAMFIQSPEAWVKAGNHAGLLGEDFAHMVKQWNRTGLKDSVAQYGDYNSAINGFGMTAQAFKKAAVVSTLPFKEGELFVRGMGWLMARDMFLRGKRAGYKLTAKDEAFILKDSYRHTMNLGRANRAAWQKGIMSIPTQFWQITTKFVENMLPELFGVPKNVHNWTPKQRAQILMFGTVLPFGAAGLPFGRTLLGQMSDLYNEGKPEGEQIRGVEQVNLFQNFGMSKEAWTRLIDQGVVGLAGWELTGNDLSMSARGSIAAGVEETIRNFKNADGVWDRAFAASGQPMTRAWAAINTISSLWAIPDWTFDEYKIAANEVASIASSWSNAHKALWWASQGHITDAKGRTIDDLDPKEDYSMLLWQALGFPPGKVDYLYSANAYNRKVEGGIAKFEQGIVQEKADAITTLLVKYGANEYSPDRERRMQILIDAVLKDIDPAAPLRDKVIEKVNSGLLGKDTRLEAILEKTITAKMESRENAVGMESVFTNPLFVEKGK